MIFWVPVDRVSDALQALTDARERCGVTWTQGRSHSPATGAQLRVLREAGAGKATLPGDLHMRIIFTNKADAMLFKLRWN